MIQSADAESTGGGPSSRSPPLVHDQDIDSEFGEETSGEGPGETGSDDEDLSHPLASHQQVRRPRSSIESVLCGMGLHLGEDRRIMKGHCRPTSDRERALEAWNRCGRVPSNSLPSIIESEVTFHIEPIQDLPEQAPPCPRSVEIEVIVGQDQPSECASMVEVPDRIRQSFDALTLCFSSRLHPLPSCRFSGLGFPGFVS